MQRHVSIQPKPKKGLVGTDAYMKIYPKASFNPAEAEEGFSSVAGSKDRLSKYGGFNPAEAEEGFSRKILN